MGRIPEETIQSVLAATDIVDLVSSYHIDLKRAGSNFKALCPFHQEKTPSFVVTPSRNTFHCFGCGAGGSAIGFVMDYENLTYPEAIRKLADRAGIQITEDTPDPKAEQRDRLRRRLLLLHNQIARWFHQLLLEDPDASAARDYLRRRGIDRPTASDWLLGFAPAQTKRYADWARDAGFSAKELVTGGLLALRDEDRPSAGTYPRFRDRLMFPVRNTSSDVIAFSGRLLDDHAKAAKYINSPETPIFNKSQTFYGLHRAVRPIIKAGRAILCEGQIDLITAAVAALGTAFTEHPARTLARYAAEVVVCFDADAAGAKATERAHAQLASADLDVRVAVMPQGQDPDSLIRSQGADAFIQLVDHAQPFFDFLVDRAQSSLDLSSIKDRVAFANRLAENIAHLNDPIAVDTAILQTSTRLRLSPDELRDLVRQHKRRKHASPNRQSPPGPPTSRHDQPARHNHQPSAPPQPQNRSLDALCVIASTDPDSHRWLNDPARLDLLQQVPGSGLLLQLLAARGADEPASHSAAVLSSLGPDQEPTLATLLAKPIPGTGLDDARLFFLDLEHSTLKRQLDGLKASLTSPSPESLQQIADLKLRMSEVRAEQARLASRER